MLCETSNLDSSISLLMSSGISVMEVDEDEEEEMNRDSPNKKKDQYQKFLRKWIGHYLRHNETLIAMEELMKIVNTLPGSVLKFPTSKHSILAEFPNKFDVSMFIKCKICKEYTKTEKGRKSQRIPCQKCACSLQAKESNFFLYISLQDQLTHSIKRNWSRMNQFKSQHNTANITDFQYSRAAENVSTFLLPLMLNTDGAKVFKSCSKSLWTIQLIQNFLPPELRYLYANVIVVGFHYSCEKPDFNMFLYPLVSELMSLKKFRLILEGREIQFQPYISSCSVDLPALSLIQMIKQYNGYFACSKCLHPGENIPNLDPQPNRKKSFPIIRYTVGDYEKRTHLGTIKTIIENGKKKFEDVKDGVKGMTPMIGFNHFDIIEGFAIDYMHGVLLGVVTNLLDFYVDSKYSTKDFNLKSKTTLLNNRLLSLKPSNLISRRPRDLKHRKSYKANELRNLLLYYLRVCLDGILERKYLDHFQLLSSAIYALLQEEISEEMLCIADVKLKQFVVKYQEFFGKISVVMNVHLLTHLVDCVRKLGPLWSHSCFTFEGMNGQLIKLVQGTNDVLFQMTTKYCLKRQHFDYSIENNKNNDPVLLGKSELISISDNMDELTAFKRSQFNLTHNSIDIFRRLRIGNDIYTSKKYTRAKASNDSFVGLSNGTFGMAKYYFSVNNKAFIMLEVFAEVNRFDQYREVYSNGETSVVDARIIDEKFIHIKVNNRQYIVSLPNRYEKD